MVDVQRADLLVELGCEELPPKALATLAKAFFDGVCQGLGDARLSFDRDASQHWYSPRRMTLLLSGLEDRQPDQLLERKGPSVKAAFDDNGEPTRAATGFAASVGRTVEELERLETDKGAWLYCKVEQPGKPLDELLYPILQEALSRLPVPKPMRWSDHEFSFVRPVHWLAVLHGDRVIEGSLYGCTADRLTRGHRIHAPGPHPLDNAAAYVETLREAFVLVDPAERLERIRSTAEAAGAALGGVTRITDSLLGEVNNLVEWPVPVSCSFEPEFLAVPAEALIASMESHQKFFPVLDGPEGALTEHFVVMANLESRDVDQVRAGFERVVRPRLADAAFFWNQDLKQPLEAALSGLDAVVFQEKMGSIGDKSRRIAALSKKLAEVLGEDAAHAERAALLSKCDLSSLMVGEFPELQGTMGGYYALASDEPVAVSDGIASHYQPRFAGDAIPATGTGRMVALADRLDTLVGIFAAGLKPTGNKDPFALRRSSLGIVRILLEGGYGANLDELLSMTAEGLEGQMDIPTDTLGDVRSFIHDRLRQMLRDQGHTANVVAAALAAPLRSLPDLVARLMAVTEFMGQSAAESLVAANKRIGNILKKQAETISEKIDSDQFVLPEEKALFDEVKNLEDSLAPLFDSARYAEALEQLASLRASVDAYFDEVMIMDEDAAIRQNRLAQLKRMKALFDRIADFSQAG